MYNSFAGIIKDFFCTVAKYIPHTPTPSHTLYKSLIKQSNNGGLILGSPVGREILGRHQGIGLSFDVPNVSFEFVITITVR